MSINSLFIIVPLVFSSLSIFAMDIIKGKQIYQNTCSVCHQTGINQAPRAGNSQDWKPRIERGFDTLYKNAANGYKLMPAKGGNLNLTDADLKNAIHYMVANVSSDDKVPSPLENNSREFVTVLKLNEKYNFPVDEKGFFKPKSVDDAPKDKFGEEVRLGYKIFTETQKYAPRYAGRGLTCQSCHLQAGMKPYAVPMWGAIGIYPVYRVSSDRSDNMPDRIQSCFRASLNGFAPPHDSPEMRALISYIQFVSHGVPIGVSLPGRSMPDEGKFSLPLAGAEPSPSRGKVVFESKCTACHAQDGKGKKREDGTYQFPPLWGWDSFNKSASFYKNDYLARFIWANMPLGQDYSLTPQEAWDVATYINIHERPKDPHKGLWSELFGK